MEKLSKEKKGKLKEIFGKKIDEVDENDVKDTIDKVKGKIEKLSENTPEVLLDLFNDIKNMWSLLVDYYDGRYKKVPWKTIAAIVVALLYFANPIDIIPDFIPVVGYIDDAFVVYLALQLASDDLEEYRKWRAEQEDVNG